MDFDYLSYSPDMESIDFHLFFVHIKSFMGGQNCNEDDEVNENVTNTQLQSQAASGYDEGIQKLVPQYKCLSNDGNYVEKQPNTYMYFKFK